MSSLRCHTVGWCPNATQATSWWLTDACFLLRGVRRFCGRPLPHRAKLQVVCLAPTSLAATATPDAATSYPEAAAIITTASTAP